MLWTEKYRPKSPLPSPSFNILLHGKPSTGKTTYAHRLAGKAIELNASNNRGINAIRKLQNYQNTTIILDECDNLTPDAQTCLRRVMEFSTCRFILIANYISKIILPLRSRLYPIKFQSDFLPFLYTVMEKENMDIDLEYLWVKSKQDIRKCLNTMQAIKSITNEEKMSDDISLSDEDIKSSDVHLINYFLNIIPSNVIQDFFSLEDQKITSFVNCFIQANYSVSDFIEILANSEDIRFSSFFAVLSSADEMCVRGGDSELILYYLCAEFVSMNKLSSS